MGALSRTTNTAVTINTANVAKAAASEVVVITGPATGIGRATARLYARDGAKIALLADDTALLAPLVDDIRRLGGDAVALAVEASDPAAVERAAAAVEDAFGPITIWINNTLAAVLAGLTAADDAQQCAETAYFGYLYGTMSALRRMQRRNHGTVIQVGAADQYAPHASACAAAATKAVQGFTSSLLHELQAEGSGVHLTVVELPAQRKGFDLLASRLRHRARPVPALYQPELGAAAIVWSAKHPEQRLPRAAKLRRVVGTATVNGRAGAAAPANRAEKKSRRASLLPTAPWGYEAVDTAASPAPRPLARPVAGNPAAAGAALNRDEAQARGLAARTGLSWRATHRKLLALGGRCADGWRFGLPALDMPIARHA